MMEVIMDEEQIPKLRTDVHECIYMYVCVYILALCCNILQDLPPQHHIH